MSSISGMEQSTNFDFVITSTCPFPCKFISGASPPANQNREGGSEPSQPGPGKYLQGNVNPIF